jgi:hypothetical protein
MALEELKTEDVVIDFPEVVFSSGEMLALQKAEQELADLKQQMAALSLVALFEDLPMGTPSLICRHVLCGADCAFECRRPRGILLPQLCAGVPRQETSL